MNFGFFKHLAKFFRSKAPKTPLARLSYADGGTSSSHPRVCDLTRQLSDIPLCPTASGGYSHVWKCTLIKDGTVLKVAAKAIKQGANDNAALRKALKRGKRELDVWAKLQHAHVLPLYGVAHGFLSGITVMVCPWMDNGTVTNFIQSHRDLSEIYRLQLICDVADGLRYLHSQPIVHGDLTGLNILVCAKGRAHLADFGLSIMLTEQGMVSHSLTGASRWAAPELILVTCPMDIGDMLSFQSDMYSFGSIMFHILSGIIPYHGLMQSTQVIMAIMRGEKPHRHRPKELPISDRCWDFIQRCWSRQKFCRPSANEAYNFLQRERDFTTASPGIMMHSNSY